MPEGTKYACPYSGHETGNRQFSELNNVCCVITHSPKHVLANLKHIESQSFMRNKIRYFLYHIKLVLVVIVLAYLTCFLYYETIPYGITHLRFFNFEDIVMPIAWALSILFTVQAIKPLVPLKIRQRILQAIWKPYNPLRQIVKKTDNLYIKIVLTIIAIALCSIASNGIAIDGDVDTRSSVSGQVEVSGDVDTSVSGQVDVY